MEWLSNLLGFANQGTSPFGSLSGSSAMPPPGGAPPAAPGGGYNGPAGNIGFGQGVGATGPIPAAATPPAGGAAAPGGMQMPGLLGKLMGQQPQAGAAGGTGLAGGNPSGALLGQALGLLKGQQIQAPPMMNLLSGPRG